MEKELNIEMQPGVEPVAEDMRLPVNFITVGTIENDDVKVYIKQDVYKAIERLANSDTSKELGSILFGHYMEDMGKLYVVISEFAEAKYTDASASTLTFTHETWDYVHSVHDEKYPSQRILGWQHTHPQYGIFLSNYDIFIQENFFNLPFQIAYVVDPLQNLRGFFQWKNGKVEKLGGFYVFDDEAKPVKIEQQRPKTAPASQTRKQFTLFLSLMAAVMLMTIVGLLLLNGRLQTQFRQQQELMNTIQEQDSSIQTMQKALDDDASGTDSSATVQELIEKIESQQIQIDNQDEVLRELQAMLPAEGSDAAGSVTLKVYTVEKGDSLLGICKQFGVDYRANLHIIMALNGISDADFIYAGQSILLPVQEPNP